jgi:flagellar basal-body rod protein FlgB
LIGVQAMLEASQYRPSSLEMIGGAKAHIAARAEDQGQDLKHKYRVSSQGSVDGNTVEVDVERVQFAENTLRFKFALQMASEESQ